MAAPSQGYGSQPQSRAAAGSQAPPAQQQAATSSGGGGLFGQMASTAAGVAVGSTVGHGLSSMLFGGGGSQAAPAPEQQQPYNVQAQEFAQEQSRMGASCEAQSKGALCVSQVVMSTSPLLTIAASLCLHLLRLPPMPRGYKQQHGLVLLLPRAAQAVPGRCQALLIVFALRRSPLICNQCISSHVLHTSRALTHNNISLIIHVERTNKQTNKEQPEKKETGQRCQVAHRHASFQEAK